MARVEEARAACAGTCGSCFKLFIVIWWDMDVIDKGEGVFMCVRVWWLWVRKN